MAQYGKSDAVAVRKSRGDVVVTIWMTRPDFKWHVQVDGRNRKLAAVLEKMYFSMLTDFVDLELSEHGGSIPVAFGEPAGYLFNEAVRQFGFEVVQRFSEMQHEPADKPRIH